MSLRIGSLFSGVGGLDLAVESFFGAETAWHCEFDAEPSKVLAAHWPGVPNLGDITAVDWSTVEPVDIICGGSPCQDVSAAGPRTGMVDGTRSNLWVQMREAIAYLKPSVVIWENVRGALSAYAFSSVESDPGLLGEHGPDRPALRAVGRVIGDLSALGYDTVWTTVPASDVGAPHRRERVFVLAYAQVADATGGHANRSGARSGELLLPGVARRVQDDGLDWKQYEPAVRRWEALTRPAPAPTRPDGKAGRHRLSPLLPEWMMGYPAGWVTDVIGRDPAIKACGNGVVPQQAHHAIAITWNRALAHIREETAA